MKKLYGVIVALCVMCLSGCGEHAQESFIEQPKQEEKLQIGMCLDSFVIERWQRDRDVFVSTAQELGASVDVQNASGDTQTQIEQIRYFIEQKVDVIVVIPTDVEAISDVIKEAKKAKIKVLSYDRLVADADVDLYISFDNEEVGRLMAKALAKQLPTGANIVMLAGPTTDSNVLHIQNGFEEIAIQEGMNIIDITYVEGWKPEIAYQYMSSEHAQLNEIDGIMCGNDSIASQMVKYLAECRKAGEIEIVGQDAELEACQHIMEGTQLMTVYKAVDQLATIAAEYAVALAKNEIINVEQSITDGTYMIPYIALEPVAVNRSNMDEIIVNSGFHLKEDVYLNIANNDE